MSAINVVRSLVAFQQQPINFYTHELMGSSLHEELHATDNNVAIQVSGVEIILLDYNCPSCYPADYERQVQELERYNAQRAAGRIRKEDYGYNDTYTNYRS